MPLEGKNKFIVELKESKDALSRSAYSMLEQRIQQLERHREQLEFLLEKTLSSRSWRVTAPLRGLVHSIRTLWPLYTNRTTELTPLAGLNTLETSPGRFQVLGPGASVLLRTSLSVFDDSADESVAKNLVTGACILEAITGPLTKRLQGYLSYDRGGGFIAGEREFVSLGDKPQLVLLPPDTKAIRFEPFLDIGSFELRAITLKKLGSLKHIRLNLESKKRKPKPRVFLARITKGWMVLRQGGLSALTIRLLRFERQDNYHEWVRRYDTLQSSDIAAMKRHQAQFAYTPRFSIVMPVCDPDVRWLKRAVDSVLGQVYQNFELCIADDGSETAAVRAMLHEYQTKDSRIKVTFRRERGHIAAATNTALSAAVGDYVVFLDHDDELTPHALYCFAARLQQLDGDNHRPKLLYSDEDKISETGQRFSPYFKTDFDNELLRSQNFICHCLCLERNVITKLGGLRSAIYDTPIDGAQDWDLVLRAVQLLDRSTIAHIPHILYHWRATSTSTASSYAAKPYVLAAQQAVVIEHLIQTHAPHVSVEMLNLISHVSPVYTLPAPPTTALLLIRRREKESPKATAITLPASVRFKLEEGVEQVAFFDDQIAEINAFIRGSSSELLIVADERVEIKDKSSLDELLALALISKNGVIAPKILDANRKIVQSALILGRGELFEPAANGKPEHDVGYFKRLMLRHGASAINGGCFVVRTAHVKNVNGFDEALPFTLAKADFCLKLHTLGFENIVTPFVHVREMVVEKNVPTEIQFSGDARELFAERWKKYLESDPYFNQNFSLVGEDVYSLAFPPRSPRPWLSR